MFKDICKYIIMTTKSAPDISCISNDELEERIGIVMRQTEYTEEEAETALTKNNYDTISCIKEYLGIPLQKEPEKKGSVNQEIYKQLRKQMGVVTKPPSELRPMER
jgi:hypothetical protein